MTHAPDDHAGILVVLDRTGRTIAALELRVDELTEQVAMVSAQRDQLAHLLTEARAAADAAHVPPPNGTGGENERHASPPTAPD